MIVTSVIKREVLTIGYLVDAPLTSGIVILSPEPGTTPLSTPPTFQLPAAS